MTRGVRWSLLSSVILVALIALAGCSHYMMADREPWRRDAELACLNAGAVKELPTRVRISSIDGPGACGISYPLKVSSLGDSGPLGYDDELLTPPGSIPNAGPSNSSMPQHWPIAQPNSVQSNSLPPLQSPQSPYSPPPAQSYNARPSYQPPQPYSSAANLFAAATDLRAVSGIAASIRSAAIWRAAAGAPLSIQAPGIPEPVEEDAESPGAPSYPPNYSTRPPTDPIPPLGPARDPAFASGGPVELKPAATLACPIVSALDQWINNAVQPAAQRWFHQPVVEIKQISAYPAAA